MVGAGYTTTTDISKESCGGLAQIPSGPRILHFADTEDLRVAPVSRERRTQLDLMTPTNGEG